MMLVSSCASVKVSEDGICQGTLKSRDNHTDALLIDGGDLSVVTGEILISSIDAACQDQ